MNSNTRERGLELLKANEYEAAIQEFDLAITSDAADAQAYLGCALCWHHLGERANALADYDATIRIDPEVAPAWLGRGDLRLEYKETGAAIADLDEAIRLDPEIARAYLTRARAWASDDDFERSLADLDEALLLKPEYAVAHRWRSHALQQLDRTDEALEALNEAIRIEPNNSYGRNARAELLQNLGDYDAAENDLATAANSDTSESMKKSRRTLIAGILEEHFAPESPDNITITEREFPTRVRTDLQRAVDRLFTADTSVAHFCGVLQQYSHEGLDFAQLITPSSHNPATSAPPQYEETDIGEDQPVRCLKNGLWLLCEGESKFAVLLAPAGQHGMVTGLKFQVANINNSDGTRITQEFFKHLEDSVLKSESYRGKILSLGMADRYHGFSSGITVHKLASVERDEVILPRQTLELLDRNVISFTQQRPRLAELGLPTKKGLLFYGPPGTGKTHTIHYLAKALEGHTTLLITAEQVGLLEEYMTLARLLQPSVVVIEDVDLIARDRSEMGACDELLLNKLLNEMDGLRPKADVLFILTTNRPESLEMALAARPGRIDQAIEFPLPDAEGRAKLVRLYSCGLTLSDELIETTVSKTEKVSASFIKELMRRAAQFQIERNGDGSEIELGDIDNALEEMLFTGGSLNRKLLGANIDSA